MKKNFNCKFETGKRHMEVSFVFEGDTPDQAKFYIINNYPDAKNIVVKPV